MTAKTKTVTGTMQGAVDKIQEFMSDLVGNVKPTAARVAKGVSATAKRAVTKTKRAMTTTKRAATKTKRATASGPARRDRGRRSRIGRSCAAGRRAC